MKAIIIQWFALGKEIFDIIFSFGKKHPLATLTFLAGELWIHSLTFDHVSEIVATIKDLKDLLKLIPIIGG